MVIEGCEVSDRFEEISSEMGNPAVADFKIIWIVPLGGKIAAAIEFYLDPGEVLAVLPDDMATQERIVQSNRVGLFGKLLLQASTQRMQHLGRAGQPPSPDLDTQLISPIAQTDKRPPFFRIGAVVRRPVEHCVTVQTTEQPAFLTPFFL